MTPTVTPTGTTPGAYAPGSPPASTPTPPSATPPTKVVNTGWAKYRWTTAAYRKLYATGLFNDVKTMLLGGEVYTMVMPNPPHDIGLNLAYEYLRAVCPPGHYVRNQQGLDTGEKDDPGPDLAVVPGSIRESTATPTTALWVVEVSDTTVFEDTTVKAEKYATAGIQDYWVVDVKNRKLLVYRKPAPLPEGLGATAYRSHEEYGPDESVAPLAAPDKPVKVADLLP